MLSNRIQAFLNTILNRNQIMNTNYALDNPISIILDKPRTDFTRNDLLHIIELRQIEKITFHYTGLDGKLKELKLPVANREQAERILAGGERVDGSSLFKGLIDTSVSDLYVVPIFKTAFINPMDETSLDFICRYINKDGEMASFALDTILHKAHELFKQSTGYELYALGELEFYLIGSTDNPLYPVSKQKGYHASAPFIKSGTIVNEIVKHLTQITGCIKYAHNEVGYVNKTRSDLPEINGKPAEQIEVEFLPAPITDMADYLVLARWLIRNIAYKHGYIATFTPKIEEGIAGNGYHFHMALMKNGKNMMTDDDGRLSKPAHKLIGGLCHYADSLTAFGNTTSSAYLRLVPNQEAPVRICWSELNRSAMIRVPLGWPKNTDLSSKINDQNDPKYIDPVGRQTIELRSPDGSANTHLLLAGITMAAEWGLTTDDSINVANKLHVTGNIFDKKRTEFPALPRSCSESASVLISNQDKYIRNNIFPPEMIEYVTSILNNENDKDINKYLADLPADDRLHETRKIMHKDLHRH